MKGKKGGTGLVIIIIIIILLFIIKVPFHTFEPTTMTKLICINGVLTEEKSGFNSIIGSDFERELTLTTNANFCSAQIGGSSATAQIMCIDDKPQVVCRTSLANALLNGKFEFLSINDKNLKSQETSEEPTCSTPSPLDIRSGYIKICLSETSDTEAINEGCLNACEDRGYSGKYLFTQGGIDRRVLINCNCNGNLKILSTDIIVPEGYSLMEDGSIRNVQEIVEEYNEKQRLAEESRILDSERYEICKPLYEGLNINMDAQEVYIFREENHFKFLETEEELLVSEKLTILPKTDQPQCELHLTFNNPYLIIPPGDRHAARNTMFYSKGESEARVIKKEIYYEGVLVYSHS